MVKGISRRVVVVDSPDQRFFEQAIFIVRNDAAGEGVTARELVEEARRVALLSAMAASSRSQYSSTIRASSNAVPPLHFSTRSFRTELTCCFDFTIIFSESEWCSDGKP